MAYKGSKGWYIEQLKRKGIRKHPEDHRKLEQHKTHVLRNLFFKFVLMNEQQKDSS